MIATEAFAQVEFTSAEALWQWLGLNHGQRDSVWAVTYKKHVAGRYVSRVEVLDALVAHGWIDGIRRKLDDDRTMQLISPRKQQAWAKSYKDRAQKLIDEGRMHPAGYASLAAGKASGLWNAMERVDALEVPPDLETALNASGGADWFAAAASSYRRNVLRWIAGAKRDTTRAGRIAKAAESAARATKMPNF